MVYEYGDLEAGDTELGAQIGQSKASGSRACAATPFTDAARLTARTLGEQRRRLWHHHGIAIAPILFVVAVLAVLAMAIAASSGTFSHSTATEKARSLASEMINDAILLKQAVARVTALGCTETQINFYDAATSATNQSNPSAPADGHCNIFSPLGGGLVYGSLLDDACNGGTCTRRATGMNAVPGFAPAHPNCCG